MKNVLLLCLVWSLTIVKAVKVAIAVIPMIRNIPITRPDWCNAHGKATTDVPIIVFHMANLKKNIVLDISLADLVITKFEYWMNSLICLATQNWEKLFNIYVPGFS